jgi:hypothetical protein
MHSGFLDFPFGRFAPSGSLGMTVVPPRTGLELILCLPTLPGSHKLAFRANSFRAFGRFSAVALRAAKQQ